MLNIQDMAYYLPNNVVTNEILKEQNPDWDIDNLIKRTGVEKRHIASKGETALDLAFKACKVLFSNGDDLRKTIDCIIFCTQSPDYIMPPNSCILHQLLDLHEDVLAFDFNLACSGYIYGISLANGLLCPGSVNNILLVNADTYSKYINKQDRSTRMLFGDGAAVTILNQSKNYGGKVLDIICSTSGENHDKFIIPAGGCRNPRSNNTNISEVDKSGNIRTKEQIYMNGLGILAFISTKIPSQIIKILLRNNMKIKDVDLFVFHQASKMALDSLRKKLKIPPDKMYSNINYIGNTVSASIPIALYDALNNNLINKGNIVLLCGFGVGLSWGTALVEY